MSAESKFKEICKFNDLNKLKEYVAQKDPDFLKDVTDPKNFGWLCGYYVEEDHYKGFISMEIIDYVYNLYKPDINYYAAGWNYIHIAIYRRRPEIVKYLLEKGADPHIKDERSYDCWEAIADKTRFVDDKFLKDDHKKIEILEILKPYET